MAGEQFNLEWVLKVVNDAKAGIDSAVADYKRLGGAAASASKAGESIGGAHQQQRMSGLHTRITQLTTGFRKLGVELETIDLYFISGFKIVGLFKLLDFTKQAILGAEQYANSLRGVAAIARSSRQDVEGVFNAINSLAKDGRVAVSDLAEAMRYLLPKYGLEDTVKMIEALKTTGTGLGTQKQLPLGEAIKRSAQGITQWISTLSDATLVTENLDSMVDKYAKTLGVSSDKLDQNQKFHAVLIGFMKEAANVQEAEKLAMEGLTGTISKYNQALIEFKNTYGQTLTPMTVEIVKFLTEVTKALGKYIFALEKGYLSIEHLMGMMSIKIKSMFSWTSAAESLDYMRQQYDIAIKELEAKYGMGQTIKGAQIEISANFKNMAPPAEANWWGDRSFTPVEGDVDYPKNMTKLIDNNYKAFDEGMTQKVELARKWGEKIAQAFNYPLERGMSDVFFSLFSGQKKSFAEMARNFGLAMGRAISDALAEALVMPVKKITTSMFTSMAGSLAGGSLGNLFTTKTAIPTTSAPDLPSITVNSPITVHANDTNSFAKTLKQTSKLAAGLMVKEMRKSRNMEKQFRRK